ncbi:hypothetical protein IA539_18095 [Gordonia sp. zg691]|uniref:hypothetical protein n=1 Tax=Gordonia jinghuaiqii TaxID=2758710 RepID=UPI00166252B9|nr:hypothetical protein [Gordonia jinghuaiqii]MBD0863097.1 hypothetical protein [Gordonia jinghuaiqii]
MNKIEVLVWLLPAGARKNRLLRTFGHEIAPTACIGPVLAMNVGHVVLGDGAQIGPLNLIRSLRRLTMGAGATVGSLNTISCAPEFQELHIDVGALVMGDGAIITSRHYIDCSGIVEMGDMSAIGGQRTTILSHQIDLPINVQSAGLVSLGERSLVLTNCLLLKGAALPRYSLLIAESTLSRSRKLDPPPGIYGGTPAEFIRANTVDDGESWFERVESPTTRLRVDLPRERRKARQQEKPEPESALGEQQSPRLLRKLFA